MAGSGGSRATIIVGSRHAQRQSTRVIRRKGCFRTLVSNQSAVTDYVAPPALARRDEGVRAYVRLWWRRRVEARKAFIRRLLLPRPLRLTAGRLGVAASGRRANRGAPHGPASQSEFEHADRASGRGNFAESSIATPAACISVPNIHAIDDAEAHYLGDVPRQFAHGLIVGEQTQGDRVFRVPENLRDGASEAMRRPEGQTGACARDAEQFRKPHFSFTARQRRRSRLRPPGAGWQRHGMRAGIHQAKNPRLRRQTERPVSPRRTAGQRHDLLVVNPSHLGARQSAGLLNQPEAIVPGDAVGVLHPLGISDRHAPRCQASVPAKPARLRCRSGQRGSDRCRSISPRRASRMRPGLRRNKKKGTAKAGTILRSV